MGKQQAALQQADSGFDDDFSSDLVLPSGPLSLRLSKDRHSSSNASRTGSMHHKRPHTSHSDISASTSASGSSIMFSTSSSGGDYSTASESEDQREYSSSSGILHARLQHHAQAQHEGEALALAKDKFNRTDEEVDPFGDEDEDDERSSTLKANQLPADFAQQLALSKAQAALAKESSSSSIISTTAEPLKSKQSSNKANFQDWEDDLIFASQQPLSSSRLLSKKASFSSHISDAESLNHARSNTSHSQTSSSANNKTSSCSDTGDEDFFNGIELPPSFGFARGKDMTPPSSVESKTSRKTDLQDLLTQKLRNRAGNASSPTPHVASAFTSTILQPSLGQHQPSTRQKKPASSPNHVEKLDERFEDSFILEEPTSTPTSRPGPRPSIQSSSSSRSFKNIPPSQSLDRLSPWPSDGAISSRSSSTRSNTTVRPSRSSLNLVSSPSDTSVAKAGSSSDNTANTSLGKAAARNATNMGGLRSRPSLSNLATTATTAASQSSSVRHHSLVRKQSAQAVGDLARTQSNLSERSSSSLAHYAQPTRSSLARHHLPFATISRAGPSSNSRPSSPFTSNHQQDSRFVNPPASASSSTMGSFSRLTRPTIASSAKSHKVTGSDPSGRTSASLGMPVTSNPSSPLKSMRTFRMVADSASKLSRQSLKKPQQEFGDGSELDGFDDLPVNREKEKKFVKIPIRRRQSSGMGSVDSGGSQRSLPILQAQASQYGSNHSARRERVDSAPEQLHSLTGTSKGSIRSSRKADVTRPALDTMKDQPKALASNSAKRPGLKFIRNLSAAGLSKVQGEMRWNPVLLKWEGNESSLREFDNVIASSARPALISPLGPLSPRHVYSKSPLNNTAMDTTGEGQTAQSSIEQKILSISNPHGTTPSLGGVRIVGDMIFDPVKRSWLSTSSEGEEELNFGDDENDEYSDNDQSKTRVVDAWEGGEQMRLRTRRSFANDWSSGTSSHDGEEIEWDYDKFSARQREADVRHKSEMQAWKKDSHDARQSTQHLYSIKKYLSS